MARFIVSLAVFAVGFVSAITLEGCSVFNYLDFPSLIIAVVLPFLFVSTLFGFKEMGRAFSIPLKKEPEKDKLIPALAFFKMYGKATWLAGLVGVISGVISMLVNLEDKNQVGPALALAIVSLLYSGIINLAVIIPFTIFIKKHLKEC